MFAILAKNTQSTLNKLIFQLFLASSFLFYGWSLQATRQYFSNTSEHPLAKWERYIQNDLDSCKLLALSMRTNYQHSVYDASVYHLISGSYLTRIGSFEAGIEHLRIAKSYFFQWQDFELLSKILNEIGIAFQLSGNRYEAKSYYLNAMETGAKTGNELFGVLPEINLAKLYTEQENYDLGLQHLHHYIGVLKKYQKFEALGNAYAALVDLYLTKEDIPLAIKYAREQQYYAGKSKNPTSYIQALTNQAIIAFYEEDNEKSEQLFLKILSLQKNNGHPLKLSEAYFNLAGFYVETDRKISTKFLDSAYQIAKTNRLFSMQEDVLLFMQTELEDSSATYKINELKRIIDAERTKLTANLQVDKLVDNQKANTDLRIVIYLLSGANIFLITFRIFNHLANKRKKSVS